MGRRKIAIEPITDDRNRQITFNKRKSGLLKKAYELSILCSAEICLLIFDHSGRQYQYASYNTQSTLHRYVNTGGPYESHTNESITNMLQKKAKKGAPEPQPSVVNVGPAMNLQLPPEKAAQIHQIDEEFERYRQGLAPNKDNLPPYVPGTLPPLSALPSLPTPTGLGVNPNQLFNSLMYSNDASFNDASFPDPSFSLPAPPPPPLPQTSSSSHLQAHLGQPTFTSSQPVRSSSNSISSPTVSTPSSSSTAIKKKPNLKVAIPTHGLPPTEYPPGTQPRVPPPATIRNPGSAAGLLPPYPLLTASILGPLPTLSPSMVLSPSFFTSTPYFPPGQLFPSLPNASSSNLATSSLSIATVSGLNNPETNNNANGGADNVDVKPFRSAWPPQSPAVLHGSHAGDLHLSNQFMLQAQQQQHFAEQLLKKEPAPPTTTELPFELDSSDDEEEEEEEEGGESTKASKRKNTSKGGASKKKKTDDD